MACSDKVTKYLLYVKKEKNSQKSKKTGQSKVQDAREPSAMPEKSERASSES